MRIKTEMEDIGPEVKSEVHILDNKSPLERIQTPAIDVS